MQGAADLAARQQGCAPGADAEPVNSGVLALDSDLDFAGQDQRDRPGCIGLAVAALRVVLLPSGPLPPFPVVVPRPLGLRSLLIGAGVVLCVDLELV